MYRLYRTPLKKVLNARLSVQQTLRQIQLELLAYHFRRRQSYRQNPQTHRGKHGKAHYIRDSGRLDRFG